MHQIFESSIFNTVLGDYLYLPDIFMFARVSRKLKERFLSEKFFFRLWLKKQKKINSKMDDFILPDKSPNHYKNQVLFDFYNKVLNIKKRFSVDGESSSGIQYHIRRLENRIRSDMCRIQKCIDKIKRNNSELYDMKLAMRLKLSNFYPLFQKQIHENNLQSLTEKNNELIKLLLTGIDVEEINN